MFNPFGVLILFLCAISVIRQAIHGPRAVFNIGTILAVLGSVSILWFYKDTNLRWFGDLFFLFILTTPFTIVFIAVSSGIKEKKYDIHKPRDSWIDGVFLGLPSWITFALWLFIEPTL